jgi:hypothetical protein
MDLPYYLVDVFTAVPLLGNPLAIFPDATGVDSGTMQRIARELNLSETTFIPPQESGDGRTPARARSREGDSCLDHRCGGVFFNRVEIYHNKRREND